MRSSTSNAEPGIGGSLLGARPALLFATLFALFLVAFAVRLYKLDAPGVLLDRDFTSAIFARDFYLSALDDVEPWRREVARATRLKQPTLEPPVTEWLAAKIYSLVGKEDLRYARLLTISFVLLSGWFLYRIAERLVSRDGAVFALAFYLFLPKMILLSRSFQADALMMLMFLGSLLLLVRYHERPGNRRLVFAAVAAGTAILYRPLVAFALMGAFLLPSIQSRGFWRGAFGRAAWSYVLIAAVPAALYYGYLTFVAQNFGWKLESSFRFHLYGHREYWRGWYELIVLAVGTTALVAAAAGVVMLRRQLAQPMLVGLFAGYLVFGLLFTMHIHTHGYYQAQLVPMIGIAASPVVVLVVRAFMASPGALVKVAAATVALFFLAVPALREWRDGLTGSREERPEIAREIGALVGHSHRVVFLSPYYGMPLQYYGEFTGAYWPRSISYWLYRPEGERELSIVERIAALGFEPEYFVITHFSEFERNHQDLAAYLETRCSLKARSPEYLVYEACPVAEARQGDGSAG